MTGLGVPFLRLEHRILDHAPLMPGHAGSKDVDAEVLAVDADRCQGSAG